MFLATFRNRMPRTAVRAASQRTAVIGQHMMSTNASPSQEEVYLFFSFRFCPFSNSRVADCQVRIELVAPNLYSQ
jgi:hypothetical protein